MKEYTLVFTTRDRYCKACNVLWNSDKFEMTCRGRILGEGKWYVSFTNK